MPYCRNCGAEIAPKSKFCKKCGANTVEYLRIYNDWVRKVRGGVPRLTRLISILAVFFLLSVAAYLISFGVTSYQNLESRYNIIDKECTDRANEFAANQTKNDEELANLQSSLEKINLEKQDLIRAINLSNETAKSMTMFYQDVKGQKEIIESNLGSIVAEKEKYRTSYVTATKDFQVCNETKNVLSDQLKKERAKSIALQTKLNQCNCQ